MQTDHFKGKTAVQHVAEAQAKGIVSMAEIHGAEASGSVSSATDSARNTALILVLLFFVLHATHLSSPKIIVYLSIFSFAWFIWLSGRSAWLSWSRLQRLHRVLEEEKWEIEHNREQEKEELKALYRAKGFEGKLLNDVIEVLMADGDRLLKVMIEEELGLSLESEEHPLKQGLGAGIGVLFTAFFGIVALYLFSSLGLVLACSLILVLSSFISAYYQKNRLTLMIIWNSGIAVLAVASIYFGIKFFQDIGVI